MNHSVFGRKLSRSKNERRRLFSNLLRDLILHGKIVTSRAKAKAVQPLAEQLVTKAKKGRDVDRRHILAILPYGDIVDRLFLDAKDRFFQRTSGFTRIIRLGISRSDNAQEVILSFVDEAVKRESVVHEKPAKKEIGDKKHVAKVIKKTKKAK